jgi:sec-independent protein translocase protein TatC
MNLSVAWSILRARGIVRRAGICLAAYLVAFVWVMLPIPFVTVRSVTQITMELLAEPFSAHLIGCDFCGVEGIRQFFSYFRLAALLAAVLAHPVLIYHFLALVSPAPVDPKRLYLTTVAMLASFTIGMLLGYIVVLPVGIGIMINWNPMSIEVNWRFSEYVRTVSTLLVCLGLAFELPALVSGLVRLGVLTRHRPAS